MRFKVIARKHPQNPTSPKKYYATAVNEGKITLDLFAREIAARSSLTQGDIFNVLQNFVEQLLLFLRMGKSVQLGQLGTMRLSISSEGVDSKSDFSTSRIKNVHIIFTPSSTLKKEISTTSLEQVKD